MLSELLVLNLLVDIENSDKENKHFNVKKTKKINHV